MLVMLSPIFVADTKIIFGYNFVAPLIIFLDVNFLKSILVPLTCVPSLDWGMYIVTFAKTTSKKIAALI